MLIHPLWWFPDQRGPATSRSSATPNRNDLPAPNDGGTLADGSNRGKCMKVATSHLRATYTDWVVGWEISLFLLYFYNNKKEVPLHGK
jgi:hypothetical protein